MRMEETRNVYKRTTLGGLLDDITSGVQSLTTTFSTLAQTQLDYQQSRAQVDQQIQAMSAPSPTAPAPAYSTQPMQAKSNLAAYALPIALVAGLLLWKMKR